jgi:glycosidase
MIELNQQHLAGVVFAAIPRGMAGEPAHRFANGFHQTEFVVLHDHASCVASGWHAGLKKGSMAPELRDEYSNIHFVPLAHNPAMIISHPEYLHHIEIDNKSGLPRAITLSGAPAFRIALPSVDLALSVNGQEVRSATGGIDCVGAETLSGVIRQGDPIWASTHEGDVCAIPVRIGPLAARVEYLFRRHGPALSLRLTLQGEQDTALLIRNLTCTAETELPEGDWRLNAPGNGFGRDIPLAQLAGWSGISAVGGLRGSSAVVHLGDGRRNVAYWLRHELEVSDIRIKGGEARRLSLELITNFAADASCMGLARIDLFDIDLRVPDFRAFAETFQTWMRLSGHTTPANPPDWIGKASIYEAQIGFSVFYPGHRYQPYPEVSDLTADLDRIAALGFNVIQLMPRQPYPSYNVHDYWDVATSFGDVAQVKTLVAECHGRGMRIILDVLLHGVLDQESITTAADGVRNGPYAHLVGSTTSDSFASDVGEWNDYLIAWSRHIIDFEPYWKAGSPPVSPLIAQHPDWFFRDSNGAVAGIYTKAFDARNPEWQAYFTDAMRYLLSELGVDGFRFDAPTYNDFPNWADWARHRAGMSALACVPLFENLRPALKALRPDVLMYTEPSGLLLRRSMDLNYNYDEQWLVTAILQSDTAKAWAVRNARGLARWVQDRDAFLPRGALTAHHIDSHDTFWWPSWGSKWRREQFTLHEVKLLSLIFMSLPGPYMMFTGGELGIEAELAAFNALKRQTSDWAAMPVAWLTDDSVPEDIFAILRSDDQREVVTLVNLGERPASVVVPSALAGAEVSVALCVGEAPTIAVDGRTLRVDLGARSAAVLARQ